MVTTWGNKRATACRKVAALLLGLIAVHDGLAASPSSSTTRPPAARSAKQHVDSKQATGRSRGVPPERDVKLAQAEAPVEAGEPLPPVLPSEPLAAPVTAAPSVPLAPAPAGYVHYGLLDDSLLSQQVPLSNHGPWQQGVPDFPSSGPSERFYNDHETQSFRSTYASADPEADAWTQQAYERVLDLIPDGNDRELVKRVREVTRTTEIGEDTTNEQWVTVRNQGKQITWGGRLESDWNNWISDQEFGNQQNYFEFRRLRLSAAGEGYGVYDYQLELEFSPEPISNFDIATAPPSVTLMDAYLGFKDLPLLGYLMVGNFRAPIGLSNTTSTRFETFMERSLTTRLLPGRQMGVSSFNRSRMYATTWSYGAYFYDLDGSAHRSMDDNQGLRLITRGTWTPLYDECSGGSYLLHTGLGYSYNRPRLESTGAGDVREVRFSARPEIHQSDRLIDTGLLNAQNYQVLNGELAWVNGPLTVQSEMNWVNLNLNNASNANLYGTYVQASYFLTGEVRPYDRNFAVFRRVVPYENFWMVRTPHGNQVGWGAWEMAFRWSQLTFADLNGQRLDDLTTGLNWYWNPNVRWMVNWIHPFAHASPVGTSIDSQGDILALRMQLDF